MLKKDVRKRILDATWKTREKENLSQFKSRIRKQSIGAIDDLIIIAERMDEDVNAEIFDVVRIERLSRALLGLRLKEMQTSRLTESLRVLKKRIDEEQDAKKKIDLQKRFESEASTLGEQIASINPRQVRIAEVFAANGIEYIRNEFSKVEKEDAIGIKNIRTLLESEEYVRSAKARVIEAAESIDKISDYTKIKPKWDALMKIMAKSFDRVIRLEDGAKTSL